MTELPKIELDGAAPHVPADPVEIGALMREMRMGAKRELNDVAQELRIRQPYLEAIEEGRLDDLPGPAYATGFLRAYSEFLGLDGNMVIERIKEAGLDIDKRASLTLPSPVEEGGLPTGSILMVAALLAVVAYAGWYFIWTSDRVPLDNAGAMPAELAALTGSKASEASSPSAVPANIDPVAAPRSAEAVAATDDGKAPVQAANALPVAAKPNSAPPPTVVAAANPAPKTVTKTAKLAPKAAATKTSPPAPAAKTVAAAPAPSRTSPALVTVPTAVKIKPQTTNLAAVTPPAATAPAPAAAADVRRIKITATTDSWVEIRDANGEPLTSKLMHNGDSLDLESRPGLKLVTGNAGGLVLSVDSKKVATLGQMGEILQNVPIDADSLLSR